MILLMRFVVSGHSMEPSFKPGQSLLVSAIPYLFHKPKTGDVVVVRGPKDNRLLLKRIKKIENNEFFIIGDNQNDSADSRKFGLFERENILGKAIG